MNSWHTYLIFMFSVFTVFVFNGAIGGTLNAQQVSFVIQVENSVATVETEPLSIDFDNELFSEDENVSNVETMNLFENISCFTVVASENIPVIVTTRFEELERSANNSNDVKIEVGYINDGGECPNSTEISKELSIPFMNNKAFFHLDENLLLVRDMANPPRIVKSFVTLNTQIKPPDESISATRELMKRYEADFSITIEYL